ncbi:MAG: acetyl-CoA hydrolase/transferase C-terminal domain-containing protein [Dehalococcoidia bacterium]
MFNRVRDIPITRKPDFAADWRRHYESRLVDAETAVSHVKSGNHVAFCRGREPQALGLALAARRGELQNVRVTLPQPGRDFGWYDDDSWTDSFQVEIGITTELSRPGVNKGWVLFRVNADMAESSPDLGANPSYCADVYIVEISPPDDHGFCSFGASVWDKPMAIKTAKLVLGEVNPRMIRTYGENYVHVTEIDYFVKNEAPTGWTISRTPTREIPPLAKRFAELVGGLVNSGDTIQLGLGTISEWLPRAGAFDNHVDLGLFTELTPRGTTKLVEGGVITNKYKTIHRGRCTSTAAGGGRDDVAFINENPLFELYNVEYVVNPLTAARCDNFVAMNQGMAIDLTGQSTAETLGTYQWSGPGGQPAMVMGALMARGGRSILILPSTSNDGAQSRIVPALPEGTSITIPRYLADIVVTEYGVAYMRWKTLRERAEALIGIAHPDFRGELEKAARSRFWPH